MNSTDTNIRPSTVTTDMAVFVGSQLPGISVTQTNSFGNFNDEFFVVADSILDTSEENIASRLVVETAVWGYKHIRQRPYYWSIKHKLLARIFRTTNISLWQKHRESEFKQGLTAVMSAVIVGKHSMWVGSVGTNPVYLYRDGLIDDLTHRSDRQVEDLQAGVLGAQRFGLRPHIIKEAFLCGDIVLITTDAVAKCITENELRTVCEAAGTVEQSMTNSLVHLLSLAKERGGNGSLAACMLLKPYIENSA